MPALDVWVKNHERRGLSQARCHRFESGGNTVAKSLEWAAAARPLMHGAATN